MTFILVEDTGTTVILENIFTALFKPFTIDDVGIHTKIKGKEVAFKLEFPKRKTLISSFKTTHINFLKEELQILGIKQKLELRENQEKIKTFQKLFEEELCNDLPNALWERKKHEVSLPYE